MVLTELFVFTFPRPVLGLCRWVVVQPATSVLRSHACSAVLLWGDLAHCLPECPAFADLRAEWCNQVSVSLDSSMFWARHSWIFNPRCSLNPMTYILAHVSFVGQMCERFVALQLFFSPSWAPRCRPMFTLLGALQSLAGEHSPVSCRAPLCSFIVDLVPRQLSLRGSPGSTLLFSQFPSASSSLSQCSRGCEALVSSRLCQVEFSSCFQHCEIHLTHPWCRQGFVCVCPVKGDLVVWARRLGISGEISVDETNRRNARRSTQRQRPIVSGLDKNAEVWRTPSARNLARRNM